jgi:hypothetical protein
MMVKHNSLNCANSLLQNFPNSTVGVQNFEPLQLNYGNCQPPGRFDNPLFASPEWAQ